MTLVLTVVDKDRIVQVSDRRFTNRETKEVTEHKNKAVCVGMSYVHFAASYTGLSYIGREIIDNRTDYWLLEQLGSITRAGEPSVNQICRALGDRVTFALSRLRGDDKPLEVVLAGYDRNNHAFRATVSNMKYDNRGFYVGSRKRFVHDVQSFHAWNPMPKMYMTGARATFEADDPTARALKTCRDKVVEYLKVNRERLSEERVAEVLVWLIRAAHTHPHHGYIIGRDCLSVAAFSKHPRRNAIFGYDVGVPREPHRTTLFAGFYHRVAASSIHHAPHLADWYMDHMNVEADTNPEGVDPPPANQPVGTNLAARVRINIHNLPEGPASSPPH